MLFEGSQVADGRHAPSGVYYSYSFRRTDSDKGVVIKNNIMFKYAAYGRGRATKAAVP